MRTGLSVEGMGHSKAMSRSQGRVIVGRGLSRMAEVFTEHAGLLPTGSHLHSRKESSPARTRKEVQTQSAPPKRLSVLKHFLLSSPKAMGQFRAQRTIQRCQKPRQSLALYIF